MVSYLSVKHMLCFLWATLELVLPEKSSCMLEKINHLLASMAQEHFPDAQRQLFGHGFERRLKTRSETADTIAKASKVATAGSVKSFFRGHQGKTNI